MGFEQTGKLHEIFETKQITERFQKREFVLELGDNPRYPQHVMFQLTGDRCGNIDGFEVGEDVRVEFSLRGRQWTSPKGDVKYFNSLDVWRIDRLSDDPFAGEQPPPPDDPPPPDFDDTPF